MVESVVFNEAVTSLRLPSGQCSLPLHYICHAYLWLSYSRYFSRPCRPTV